MNKIRKSQVEYVESKMESEPNEEKWKKLHLFLDEVCATHLSENEENSENSDLDIDGHEVHEYLEFLAQPCNELLLR